MAELWTQRNLVHAVGSPSFTELSQLLTAGPEVPAGFHRGDVKPTAPENYARWYVPYGASDSTGGHWYVYDPQAAAWYSQESFGETWYLSVPGGDSLNPNDELELVMAGVPVYSTSGMGLIIPRNAASIGHLRIPPGGGATKHCLVLSRISSVWDGDAPITGTVNVAFGRNNDMLDPGSGAHALPTTAGLSYITDNKDVEFIHSGSGKQVVTAKLRAQTSVTLPTNFVIRVEARFRYKIA